MKSCSIDIALNHVAPSAKGISEPTPVPPKLCRFISAYYTETGGQKRKWKSSATSSLSRSQVRGRYWQDRVCTRSCEWPYIRPGRAISKVHCRWSKRRATRLQDITKIQRWGGHALPHLFKARYAAVHWSSAVLKQLQMVQYSAWRSTATDTLACTLIPIWHDFVPVKISFQYPPFERRSHLFAVNDGSLCGIAWRLGALGVNGLWSAILCGASMYHADRSVYYSWGPSS